LCRNWPATVQKLGARLPYFNAYGYITSAASDVLKASARDGERRTRREKPKRGRKRRGTGEKGAKGKEGSKRKEKDNGIGGESKGGATQARKK